MPEITQNDLWESAWKLLHRGQSDPKCAFSTPVVATVTADGEPRTRTIVLRKVLKVSGELLGYTDRRSNKADDLTNGSRVMSWTFWDPKKKIQLNCSGPTDWLPENLAKERFDQLPKHSRKSYATLAAPGRPQKEATDGLPKDWNQRDTRETDYAAGHFGILSTRITRAEVLQLSRDGHRRLLAERGEAEEWTFTWLVP